MGVLIAIGMVLVAALVLLAIVAKLVVQIGLIAVAVLVGVAIASFWLSAAFGAAAFFGLFELLGQNHTGWALGGALLIGAVVWVGVVRGMWRELLRFANRLMKKPTAQAPTDKQVGMAISRESIRGRKDGPKNVSNAQQRGQSEESHRQHAIS